MVQLTTIRPSVDSLIASKPLVAVFVGGTSGIGEFTVRTLADIAAKQGSKSLRIYIVGRSSVSGEKIVAECVQICPTADFIFVRANDLSLLSDVDEVVGKITELETEKTDKTTKSDKFRPHIDLLVMSQAGTIFTRQQDTREGLDFQMSLLYYSRMRFVDKFAPLLLASPSPAHVVSVFAAGKESTIDVNDLGLRKPGSYGFMAARSHVAFLTHCSFENLAEQYVGKISFTHLFPGVVPTPAYVDQSNPLWFKAAWGLAGPLMGLLGHKIGPEEIGYRVLYLATDKFPAQGAESTSAKALVGSDGVVGSGAYSIDERSESIHAGSCWKQLNKEDLKSRVKSHMIDVYSDVKTKGKIRAV